MISKHIKNVTSDIVSLTTQDLKAKSSIRVKLQPGIRKSFDYLKTSAGLHSHKNYNRPMMST